MRENRTNVTANNTNTMEERTMRVEVSGTANNYATTDNKEYTFVETYDITNPIDWQVDEMLSKANIGLQLLSKASRYCEALLLIGTPYERTDKYLYLIQDILDKGFKVSDLTNMINKIYNVADNNNINIIDIDISDSNVNNICIFFKAEIKISNDDKEGGVYIELHHYNGEVQFREACFYNYDTNRTEYICTIERLMEVINKFSNQGD